MRYEVVVPRDVRDAIGEQMEYLIAQGAPRSRVEGWAARLMARIEELGQWPRSGAVAELLSASKGQEVRRLNFGDYAVFYRLDPEDRVVHVLAFRHGRRRPWENEASDEDERARGG